MTTPEVPAETLSHQRKASDPAGSAWVSANAGSGKTHVLAQRVVRLLLSGADPGKILCLTFTKAAAANMAMRVFRTLAAWTQLDDAALAQAVRALGEEAPDAAALIAARRLFARAVETPGGLKIQTIHAFCEALLHRFPFEADVPSRFDILDEEAQADLLARARSEALHAAAQDEAAARALRALAAQTSSDGFDQIIAEALSAREDMARAARLGDALAPRLNAALGLAETDTSATLVDAILRAGVTEADRARAIQVLQSSSVTDQAQAARLRALAEPGDDAARLDLYLDVFLTAAREPRARLITAACAKAAPDVALALERERDRVLPLLDRLKSARAVEQTVTAVTIAHAILDRYRALKSRRGALDFSDLIEKAAELLRTTRAAWVLYKLDAGVDHVLVDEAQDTSPAQWDILEAITSEFTAGAGARSSNRTIFAVGDEKQSIYSFQGAAPHLFDQTRRALAKRMREAERELADVRLTLSFRSSEGVLAAVDEVYARPAARNGLIADEAPLRHQAWKARLPGLVEVWPCVGPSPKAEPRDWRLPLDSITQTDPPAVLAARIADRIAAWVAPGSHDVVHDEAGPRRVRLGDILILVRKRGALFESIIRALKARGLETAGADRLILTDHIAVMDLIAAGRVALLPQDDLALACALKSPLVGLDDDDLLRLAPNREGSLWSALARSEEPRLRDAARTVFAWRARAGLSPFVFYSHALGPDGGRRAFGARLGPEALDAVDEFLALALDHERRDAPSLHAFLHRIETARPCIKRDMEAAGQSIRVMTAHAAKGLEAKIVILPDTCSAPTGRHDPLFFKVDAPEGALPLVNPRAKDRSLRLLELRDELRARQDAEHRRLLYVAMTRAEERLYVAGAHGPSGRAAGCWYDLIEAGLDARLAEEPAPWGGEERIRRLTHAWPPGPAAAPDAPAPPPSTPPDWLTRPIEAPPQEAPVLRPSQAARGHALGGREPAAETMAPARRGALVHAALQRATVHPRLLNVNQARAFLQRAAPEAADDILDEIAADAWSAIADPALHPLFSARSRAEVAIAGLVALPNGAERRVEGRIDRLAETEDAIWIADFKTGADQGPPREDELAQIGLYSLLAALIWPEKAIRSFIVRLPGPIVHECSRASLDDALSHAGRR